MPKNNMSSLESLSKQYVHNAPLVFKRQIVKDRYGDHVTEVISVLMSTPGILHLIV